MQNTSPGDQIWSPGDLCEHFMKAPSVGSTDKLQAIAIVDVETSRDLWRQIAWQSDKARVRAIDGLPRNHENGSIFVQALCDGYWEVRAAAAQALGEIREQAFGPPLLDALQDESDFTVQQSLVRALGKCKQESAIPLVTHMLRDQDQSWLVREAAAWSLGKFGQMAPIWPLIEVLCKDPDEMVRVAAARALGEIKHPGAKNLLVEVMRGDDNEEVREAAHWALQQFEKAEGWRKLLCAIRDALRNWFGVARQKEKRSGESLLRAYWQMVHKGSLFALTRFIQDKRGFISHVELIYCDQQPTLLLSCCYQQIGQALRNEVISHLEKVMPIDPIGSMVANHRELLQEVERHVREIHAKRQCYETTIAIVELHPSGKGPTRVVLCGIGCHVVRSGDPLVLDQIQEQWRSYCQNPQGVSHLQIGYQSCETLSS